MIPLEVWRAVESLHGREWPPRDAVAADAFIAAANGESLLPLLFENAASLPPIVSAALPRHRALLRLFEQRSAALEDAARSVCEWLEDEPFIFYKGADYAHRLYARPSLRPMRDLDLLVPKGRMEAIGARLEANGMEAIFPAGAVSMIASHHERSYVGRKFAIDLHHSIIQRVRHRVDYEAIWRERERFTIGGATAWRLAPAHAIVVHAMSMSIDEFAVPLIRLVDLRMLIERAPLEDAIDVARRWQCVRALYGALRQLSRLFSDVDLEPVLAGMLPASTRTLLDREILPDIHSVPPKLSRSRQLRAKFHLLDSHGRRAMFFAYHVYAVIAGRLAARRRASSSPSRSASSER